MKIASKIFKKYGFLVILGLLTAAFVLEIQAADGQYKGIDRKKIDEAIGQLTSIAQSSSLEDLVDRINKAIPGKMSFRIYKEEIINRIIKMVEEFSQLLTNYRTWSETKPAWRIFGVEKAKNPPITKYPQYDELGKLRNDVSELIKKQLFEEYTFKINFNKLGDQIFGSYSQGIDKDDKSLVDLLDTIKEGSRERMAWWMMGNYYYPSDHYWEKKGMNRNDIDKWRDHIINYYYKELITAESDKK